MQEASRQGRDGVAAAAAFDPLNLGRRVVARERSGRAHACPAPGVLGCALADPPLTRDVPLVADLVAPVRVGDPRRRRHARAVHAARWTASCRNTRRCSTSADRWTATLPGRRCLRRPSRGWKGCWAARSGTPSRRAASSPNRSPSRSVRHRAGSPRCEPLVPEAARVHRGARPRLPGTASRSASRSPGARGTRLRGVRGDRPVRRPLRPSRRPAAPGRDVRRPVGDGDAAPAARDPTVARRVRVVPRYLGRRSTRCPRTTRRCPSRPTSTGGSWPGRIGARGRAWKRPIFHLHSAGLQVLDVVLDEVLSPLRGGALNVDIDPSGPSVDALLPALRRVQARHIPLHLLAFDVDQARTLTTELAPAGLAVTYQPVDPARQRWED